MLETQKPAVLFVSIIFLSLWSLSSRRIPGPLDFQQQTKTHQHRQRRGRVWLNRRFKHFGLRINGSVPKRHFLRIKAFVRFRSQTDIILHEDLVHLRAFPYAAGSGLDTYRLERDSVQKE